MRHLLSVVLSIILAPLTYLAAGFAAVKLDAAHLDGTTIDWTAAGIGIGAGVAAGALYAVLVMARLSPVGPMLAGLVFLGATVWFYLDSASFKRVFDFDLFHEQHILLRPVGAGTLLLSIPLLATVFSPRRWSASTQPAQPLTADAAAPAYPAAVPSAAPTYGEQPTFGEQPAYGEQPTFGEQPAYGAYGEQPTTSPAYAPYSTESTPVYQPPAGTTSSVFTPASSEPTPTPYTPTTHYSAPYQPSEPVSPPSAPPATPDWPADQAWPPRNDG